MHEILWAGDAAPNVVASSLRALHIAIAAKSAAPLAFILSTRTARDMPPAPSASVPWIWLTRAAVEDAARTEAVLRGAYDVVSFAERGAVERLVQRLKELLAREPRVEGESQLVAESEAAKKLLRQIAQAARTSMPVLLTGETGTGKEVTARLLHAWSARSAKRFIPINCAAIPNELMEGELFGYARGAFSGAVRAYDGALMAGAGGTVFLDEIDDTPFSIQVKLLRVLEDRVVIRLGETEPHKVDFRILAATTRDLRELIAKGQFGADLFERLAIVSIQLPTLRERPEDLPILTRHMIARFYREEPLARARAEVTAVSPEAMRALSAYPFPGNIRELRNVVFESLVYKRAGAELLLSDLPRRVLKRETRSEPKALVSASALSRRFDEQSFELRAEIANLERAALKEALSRTGGNATRAATLLGGVGRTSAGASDPGATVRAMMKRLGIRPK